jgi:SAM-dependent methyltransferase
MDGVNPEHANVLEIGSGTSPVKLFFPAIKTSDVLDLDYVDYIFDCHHIDSYKKIEDCSLDLIIMTNVLHHLKNPVLFLSKAAVKLRRGGVISLTEPFFSVLSKIIYKYLHHESVDLTIHKPQLDNISGPLSSANIALPFLLFFRHDEWREPLSEYFDISFCSYYTSLSYFATGGISRKVPLPRITYRFLFVLDNLIAKTMPKVFASFFSIQLTRK